jgi:hypothetical protein
MGTAAVSESRNSQEIGMPFTREDAIRALEHLGAAPIFLQSYTAKRLPENLDIYFGPPEEFFLAADTQEPYTNGRMIPILDDGNFGLVTFFDPTSQTLIQIDIESPGTTRTTFQCWQQYLGSLMISIAGSVDDDVRVRRMAGLIGFHHLDELFAFFQRISQLPDARYQEERQRFLASMSR